MAVPKLNPTQADYIRSAAEVERRASESRSAFAVKPARIEFDEIKSRRPRHPVHREETLLRTEGWTV
jgi:hypothetical protein